jgi:hypothetical protein
MMRSVAVHAAVTPRSSTVVAQRKKQYSAIILNQLIRIVTVELCAIR